MTVANRTLVLVVLVAAAGCTSSDSSSLFLIGAPVRRYAVTYRVEDGGRVSIERLVVDRPFASHLVLEGSERITAVGRLATRSSEGPWTVLEIPPAPAGRDRRPEIAIAPAAEGGLIERRGVKTVSGRRCQVYRTGGPVTSGTLSAVQPTDFRHTDFCVGRGSIVLEEIEVEDGDVTRHARATAVSTGASAGGVPAIPDAQPVALDAGGGRSQPSDPAVRPPFERFYALPADAVPSGFSRGERYAVVPLGLAGATSLVADIYTRGADVLIIDQGASTTGRPPFDAERPTFPTELGELGDGEFVIDLRANEVRIVLPDGGFLRVVGTLQPEQLIAVAQQLRPQPKEAA